MLNAFKQIEQEFLNIADNPSKIDKSGSCALICVVIGISGYKDR